MGKTYTDFSQLSKGMFRMSDPIVEVKPLPKRSACGDDVLAYFGLNVRQPHYVASGAGTTNDASAALKARVEAAEAKIKALKAEHDAAERKAFDIERQLAAERTARQAGERNATGYAARFCVRVANWRMP